jgi:hypothetical protein
LTEVRRNVQDADRTLQEELQQSSRVLCTKSERPSPWFAAMKRGTQTLPETLAPCGLVCALCPDYKDYPDGFSMTAERMRALLRQHLFAAKVATEHGKFDLREFKKGLDWFARQKNQCKGCTTGPKRTLSTLLPGCDPECPIRACARGRRIMVCFVCPDFPCFRSYYSPRGLANLRRGLKRRHHRNAL